ncbi:MAG: DNA-processing protein DprA [Bacteroidota bacterium]
MNSSSRQTTQDLSALLRLSTIPGVGPQRIRALVNHFGDAETVLRSSAKSLASVEGMNRTVAVTIAHHKGGDRFSAEQLSKLKKSGGWLCTYWDASYPFLLKKIYDPPPFLFVRGNFDQIDNYALAIVGTRKPSEYGKIIAERLAAQLVQLGLTVVSGLARGIDTIAHSTVVKNKGRTLAIIGSGIDVIYPPENKPVVERLVENGALVSEYPMGTSPDAGNFPRRNRIISGMTLATIVIETTESGGAMITATTALDQNREIFAVPGNITEPRSTGTNLLIKEGRATLLQSVDDIISVLGSKLKPIVSTRDHQPVLPELTLFEQRIFDILSDNPLHVDTIAERTSLSVSDVLVHLLGLEFKGLVKQLPGKMFRKQ